MNTKILIPKKGIIKKFTTYVPIENADALRTALFQADAGNIGNYDNCSFSVSGDGTYKGNENSNPNLGEKGKTHTEKENKISVILKVKMNLLF